MPLAPKPTRPARGFTLIEIVVVLLIIGVIIAMSATIARAVSGAQKRSLTTTRMATVEAALLQFVIQQKRLPCPADGSLVSSHMNAGVEGNRTAAAGCNVAALTNGVVPWRALGLSETDSTDGWDRRLTYRVPIGLAADNALDMTWCDPVGTAAAVGAIQACNVNTLGTCSSSVPANCTSPANFLANKGLEIRSVAGQVLMNPAAVPNTGAAYVVISPGESGGGGYLASGALSTSSVTDGTEESKNYANLAFVAGTYYLDNSLNEVSGATHFDDLVARPSIMGLVLKANLGPRTH